MLYIFLLPVVAIIAFISRSSKVFSEIGVKENTVLEPFSISAYYDRIEKANLAILEEQKPVETTIILWWGFDGLRLDEDGNLQWISRKKPEPVNQNVFYQPQQMIVPSLFCMMNMCQSPKATIDMMISQQIETIQCRKIELDALKMENTALQVQSEMEDRLRYRMIDCRNKRNTIRKF